MLPWKQWSGILSLEIRTWSSVEINTEDSGVKTMEQEENSAAGQSMEAMDQDSEGNSVSGSGAEAGSAYADGAG